ncbi:MAG: class I tRNA ligase family protein [Pseudomonadota bacterium]|nr:class I tRNA ligase family protein [Pseudomonadota bacterium]
MNIWLSGKIQDSINEMNKNITSYRFDLYAQTLYELIWDEYCDWYLELTKPILKSKNKEEVEETKYFLFHSLNTILKMAHPLIPFITEEIWSKTQDLAPTKEKGKLLAECALPQASEWKKDKKINKEIVFLKSLITGVRKIRAEMGISPGKSVNIIVVGENNEDMSLFNKYQQMFKEIARVSNINTEANLDTVPASATFVVNQLTLNIPLIDIIDKNSEIKRLTKNISKLEKALESVSSRLKNKNYLANAPENIVKKEKDLHASQLNEITKLKKQLKVLEEI